jgi:hypothetical protein
VVVQIHCPKNFKTHLEFVCIEITHNLPLNDPTDCTGDSNTSWLRLTDSTDLLDADGKLENPNRGLAIAPFPFDTPGGTGTGLRSGEGDGDGAGEDVTLGPREGGGGGGALLMPNWRSDEDEAVRRW